MCGIAGFVDFKCRGNESLLSQMTDILIHRGPDDRGTQLFKKDSYCLGLGHRRLSIIDLSQSGHQPMTFDELTVVFNGEIYNFNEIKSELESAGYVF
jgi:asparagine synthase (glutamine-hydrolysing)